MLILGEFGGSQHDVFFIRLTEMKYLQVWQSHTLSKRQF